jgi:Putative transposase
VDGQSGSVTVIQRFGSGVAADNREGLEQLARYVLRPPIAQDRLTRTADGRVLLTLKAEGSDGTTHREPRYRLGGCSAGSTAPKTVEVGRNLSKPRRAPSCRRGCETLAGHGVSSPFPSPPF